MVRLADTGVSDDDIRRPPRGDLRLASRISDFAFNENSLRRNGQVTRSS
jgi:hypothetical protein